MNDRMRARIKIGFLALMLVSVVLSVGFYSLSEKREKHFEQIEAGYRTGVIVNLGKFDKNSTENEIKKLAQLLSVGNYVATQQDAEVISQHIFNKLYEKENFDSLNLYRKFLKWVGGTKLENLGSLNKNEFALIADSVDKYQCPELQERVNESRRVLQLPADTSSLNRLYLANSDSVVNFQKGEGEISVIIKNKKKEVVPHTLIKLTQYNDIEVDSLKEKTDVERDSMLLRATMYAQTNSKGVAVFKGLDESGYYSGRTG